ncbi:MAG: hypothetical protein EA358_07420 [Flavobacteriales bacterium]|jgi:hypothetical protein|nr:MAG: hypothetical protein EA358_07420 [Flavobacteriales bacterium]
MKLREILHVSGKPGLFELKASGKNNVIASSLLDGKSTSISSRQPVMSLGDVAIYTLEEEVPLLEIFERMYTREGGPQGVSHKDSREKIETYFGEILPNYDTERVYFSDMKKVIQWYNLLLEKEILNADFFAAEKEERAQAEKAMSETEEQA